MRNYIFLIFICLLIIYLGSCDNRSSRKRKTLYKSELNYSDKVGAPKISIETLFSDTGLYVFNSNGVQLFFKNNEVFFSFNPQCQYSFPIQKKNQKIIFFWENRMNCTFDRGLGVSFPNIKNPKIGEEFGEIQLVRDSLEVEYFFQDWVNEVNSKNKDVFILFPNKFSLLYF
jgi:hypothetical protein